MDCVETVRRQWWTTLCPTQRAAADEHRPQWKGARHRATQPHQHSACQSVPGLTHHTGQCEAWPWFSLSQFRNPMRLVITFTSTVLFALPALAQANSRVGQRLAEANCSRC